MLFLSRHWLAQNSFDNLYQFNEFNKSPLVNYLLYDSLRFSTIDIKDIEILLKNNLSIDKKLGTASKYGLLEVVKYLINPRINEVNSRQGTALSGALKKANIHADDDYALRWAAKYGHLEVVKYLVSKGADIHADDDYALRWAAENGHLEVVKYLVDPRINEVNSRPKINGVNSSSSTNGAFGGTSQRGALEGQRSQPFESTSRGVI